MVFTILNTVKNQVSLFEPVSTIWLTMLNTGVRPIPPPIRTTGVERVVSRKKCPPGALTSRICPSSIEFPRKKFEDKPGG